VDNALQRVKRKVSLHLTSREAAFRRDSSAHLRADHLTSGRSLPRRIASRRERLEARLPEPKLTNSGRHRSSDRGDPPTLTRRGYAVLAPWGVNRIPPCRTL
jgi:hypothetical protein